MQFKQILLMFSALAAIAYSFPAGVETNSTSDFAQFESNATDALELKKPSVLIVEDRIPKTESVVVEFVYNNNGNSVTETKGTDKDKYDIDSSPSKKTHDQTKNPSETDKEKVMQEMNPKIKQGQENELNIPDKNSKNPQTKAEASLLSEEISPLSEKWPKYYYEAFNPIPAFPELKYGRANQINAPKEQIKNSDTYLPFYESDRKQQINVAGPPLSPLSVYDREFVVPFYE